MYNRGEKKSYHPLQTLLQTIIEESHLVQNDWNNSTVLNNVYKIWLKDHLYIKNPCWLGLQTQVNFELSTNFTKKN